MVEMGVGGTRLCEDPWIREGAAGVGGWDVQPRDPKRSLEGLGACVEGTNHQGDGRRPCCGLWTCGGRGERSGEAGERCGSAREVWCCGGFDHGLLEAGCV